MNELNSIQPLKTNHYADLKGNSVKTSGLHSIPASSLNNHSGMKALGTYNQASVSFEGFGFFNKLADKIKDKKAKHQEKKAAKLQAKAEKKAEGKAEQNQGSSETKRTEDVKEVKEKKTEEQKKADEAKEGKSKISSPQTKYDIGFHQNTSEMKYLKMEDTQTGKVTINWYNPEGSIKGVQINELGGSESYITFYDEDAQMPKEEFKTLDDGKHQYIKYRKNGLINTVTDLEGDNKTIIQFSRYHYKDDSKKIDNIKTNYPDGTSVTEWYRDNGSVEIKQFTKDTFVTKTLWYDDDGKTVRTMHTPLENGGIERTSYAKDGKILVSDRTKPDKATTDEITTYVYDDKTDDLYLTITNTSNSETIKTWYGKDEVPVCTKFSENGRETKAVWYFDDGEKPQTEELYLEDGRKQKVSFDTSERWTDFFEYDSKESLKPSKHTHYFYKENSEVPYYSASTYKDGRLEKVWYDKNENMVCRQTERNGAKTKLEWFYEDGISPKIVRDFTSDGKYTDMNFEKAAA